MNPRQSATYSLELSVPRRVRIKDPRARILERDEFYAWIWQELSPHGLLGVHEGTLLTESRTLDAAVAPRERDWISSQELEHAHLYFSSRPGAEAARDQLLECRSEVECFQVGEIHEIPVQDWDAQWKASFRGVTVEPFWRIIPPWEEPPDTEEIVLRLNPGAGFGTGTHETTQICLAALAESSRNRSLQGKRVLDFGSGSGILSIAAAALGGEVDAVEVDPLAIDNATENARLNRLEPRIRFQQVLPAVDHSFDFALAYDVVLANILKEVLLEFAPVLVERIARPGGVLILSGLMQEDLRPVLARYGQLLGGREATVKERGEWRGLVWDLH